jgi:hypothetical protein
MENRLKHYKTIIDCEQFAVTGSYMFYLCGLIPKQKVGDLDLLIVNPTPSAIEMLKKLQEKNPAKSKPYSDNMFIFMDGDVKIDIFILKNKIDTFLKFGDIEVTTILNTIDAKKSYNRFKDWKQLKQLSRLFYKQEEFDKFMEQ